jgi:hypothetical protein
MSRVLRGGQTIVRRSRINRKLPTFVQFLGPCYIRLLAHRSPPLALGVCGRGEFHS